MEQNEVTWMGGVTAGRRVDLPLHERYSRDEAAALIHEHKSLSKLCLAMGCSIKAVQDLIVHYQLWDAPGARRVMPPGWRPPTQAPAPPPRPTAPRPAADSAAGEVIEATRASGDSEIVTRVMAVIKEHPEWNGRRVASHLGVSYIRLTAELEAAEKTTFVKVRNRVLQGLAREKAQPGEAGPAAGPGADGTPRALPATVGRKDPEKLPVSVAAVAAVMSQHPEWTGEQIANHFGYMRAGGVVHLLRKEEPRLTIEALRGRLGLPDPRAAQQGQQEQGQPAAPGGAEADDSAAATGSVLAGTDPAAAAEDPSGVGGRDPARDMEAGAGQAVGHITNPEQAEDGHGSRIEDGQDPGHDDGQNGRPGAAEVAEGRLSQRLLEEFFADPERPAPGEELVAGYQIAGAVSTLIDQGVAEAEVADLPVIREGRVEVIHVQADRFHSLLPLIDVIDSCLEMGEALDVKTLTGIIAQCEDAWDEAAAAASYLPPEPTAEDLRDLAALIGATRLLGTIGAAMDSRRRGNRLARLVMQAAEKVAKEAVHPTLLAAARKHRAQLVVRALTWDYTLWGPEHKALLASVLAEVATGTETEQTRAGAAELLRLLRQVLGGEGGDRA